MEENICDETVMEEYKCPNCNLDGIVALCKEKEEQLNLAGEYGLKLQEELQECQIHMDEMRGQHEAVVEGMIQEIYELKIKLESIEKSMEDQRVIMKQTVDDFGLSKGTLINDFNEKTNVLRKENTSLLGQLTQVQLRERQLNEKVAQLEEKNEKLVGEKQKKREESNVSYSQEMFALHEKIIDLEELIETSNVDNVKLRNENEMICLSLKTIKTELINKESELEAAETKSTEYYNHWEKSCKETNDVKAELEVLALQLKQSGHLYQGNSLFGEVEDERMMMEKKLKTMEVKYESLQKAHVFLKSQHHNLKSQVTALLSLHSGKADIDYIRNIERALSQLKSENAELIGKLKTNQGNDEHGLGRTIELNMKELAKNLPNFESSEDVVEFLTIKLEECEIQMKKLQEELGQTHMFKMAESDKLLTAEQKLHETGVSAEKYKNANMKLRLKLEEAESKYKAENEKRILIEKKFNYDSSNDTEPIGISIGKINSPPPFIKREPKKLKNTNICKSNRQKSVKGKFQSYDWNEFLKALQIGNSTQKCRKTEGQKLDLQNAYPFPLINDENEPPLFETKPSLAGIAECSMSGSSERKVSFKDDVSPGLAKEDIGIEAQVKQVGVPSSCLKKQNGYKDIRGNKESDYEKSAELNFKSCSTKVNDDQPCDVQ